VPESAEAGRPGRGSIPQIGGFWAAVPGKIRHLATEGLKGNPVVPGAFCQADPLASIHAPQGESGTDPPL